MMDDDNDDYVDPYNLYQKFLVLISYLNQTSQLSLSQSGSGLPAEAAKKIAIRNNIPPLIPLSLSVSPSSAKLNIDAQSG